MQRSEALRAALGAISILAATTFGQEAVSAETKTRPISIAAFGDSLTAGYRLDRDDAFPAKLERALKAKGYDVTVANAGISGDTSRSGLGRVTRDVPKSADLVIVEFGGERHPSRCSAGRHRTEPRRHPEAPSIQR